MGMAQRIGSGQRSTRRRSVLVFVTCMLSAGAFGLLLPAASGAESVRIFADQLSSRELVPGQTVVLEAAVPVDSWCRLSLSHAGAPGDASDLRRATAGLAQFSWKVPSNIASGDWRVTVQCGRSRRALSRHVDSGASSVTLVASQTHWKARGPAARGIQVVFPRSATTPTGKGGGSYPAFGALLISGTSWLDGHGVNVYSDGGDGADGYYQCVELVNRLITTLHWSPTIWGNANQLYGDASATYFDKYGNGAGYRPVVGDIVVWGGGEGGFGHVAVVDAISGSLLTVVEENASPSGYNTYNISSSGYIAPTSFGYYVEGFLHAKADNIGQATAPAPAPPPAPTTPTTTTPAPTTPTTPAPTTPSSPAPSPQTYSETTGSVVHTWTNYSNAGGSEGPSIPSNDTVQITCKVAGFAVADGNTWWYRIASSPWSNTYYGSADAFYNDGATSGSLVGTPYFDPNVPNC
jgi:hypothetical protein